MLRGSCGSMRPSCALLMILIPLRQCGVLLACHAIVDAACMPAVGAVHERAALGAASAPAVRWWSPIAANKLHLVGLHMCCGIFGLPRPHACVAHTLWTCHACTCGDVHAGTMPLRSRAFGLRHVSNVCSMLCLTQWGCPWCALMTVCRTFCLMSIVGSAPRFGRLCGAPLQPEPSK